MLRILVLLAVSACLCQGSLDTTRILQGGYYDITPDAQMAYYPFNPAYPLRDASGNGRNLAASASAPTVVNGPWTGWHAASFNASSPTAESSSASAQYYDIPSMNLGDGVTICTWYHANAPGIGTLPVLFALRAAGAGILFGGSPHENYNDITVTYIEGSAGTGGSSTAPHIYDLWSHSEWSFVCVNWAATGVSMTKVNGGVTTDTTHEGTRSNMFNASVITIGKSFRDAHAVNETAFVGTVTHFRIFNRSLSMLEMQAIYDFAGDESDSPVVAVVCPAGHMCPPHNTGPVACPAGSYQAFPGQSVCTSCPVGTSSTGTGATSSSACVNTTTTTTTPAPTTTTAPTTTPAPTTTTTTTSAPTSDPCCKGWLIWINSSASASAPAPGVCPPSPSVPSRVVDRDVPWQSFSNGTASCSVGDPICFRSTCTGLIQGNASQPNVTTHLFQQFCASDLADARTTKGGYLSGATWVSCTYEPVYNATVTTTTTPAPAPTTTAYQVVFTATLAYDSPAAFTETLRTQYKKGVVATIAGLNPATDYVRVSLAVTTTSRRLLAGTIGVATTVSLDSAAQMEAAATSVNEGSLNAALAGYGMAVTGMTAVRTQVRPTTPARTTPPPHALTTPEPSSDLDSGAVAGIVIGACMVVLIIGLVAECVLCPSRRFSGQARAGVAFMRVKLDV